MQPKKEVIFQPPGKRVKVQAGTSILEAARMADVDLTSICGGKGKCGKCKVIVENMDAISSMTKEEKKRLTSEELSVGYRLACQSLIHDSIKIMIPEESQTGKQRLQIEGIDTSIKPIPIIKKYFVKLRAPIFEDSKLKFEEFLKSLEMQYDVKDVKIDPKIINSLISVLKRAEGKITITLWNEKRIITVEPKDTTQRSFGYSVDIGTTKLAGFLINLNTGKVIAAGSLMNPQILYGEDVISRIAYKDHKKLQNEVVKGVNTILTDLCGKTGVDLNEVYEMTVVGNTVMHHLFLNIPVKSLGVAPYMPVVRSSMDVNADAIGVKINSNGNIHALPVIAGFVGSDAVAVILATEVYKRKELSMILDIGTNTEVVLGNEDGLFACSCASGPAFEGGHIKHGMRAASGAIEKITINPDNLEVEYKTISDAKPSGICGSAIVDVPAEMLKAGIIDMSGKMNKNLNSPRLRVKEGVLEYVLAGGKETSTGTNIVITQKDIREIQLAKAAIHTGTVTLMKEARVKEDDIDRVYVAGAFGFYIRPENARMIGLFPEFSLEKVKTVGNAAGTGARMALVSKKARKTAREIVKLVKYVELAKDPNFQDELTKSISLPYADLSRYPETMNTLEKLKKHLD